MEIKSPHALAAIRYSFLCLLTISILASCDHRHRPFTPSDRNGVKDSVVRLLADVARDVSARGPVAWLDYFDDAPGFFMASDGRVALRDYPAAKKFILDTLVKSMPSITLHWTDLQIDPLSRRIASVGADYQEIVTMADRKTTADEGYFTATASLTRQGWKLHNLHWSTKLPAK
jgi:hypothetical protein